MQGPLYLQTRPERFCPGAARRSPRLTTARPSIPKQLNRAAWSVIRRDSCEDVRRRIRKEGRSRYVAGDTAVASVAGKEDGQTLSDVSPDGLNRFFVGVGPRVAGEVRDMGEVPHLPYRLPRVGACSLTLSPLTLSELRTTVFSMI